MEDHTAEKPEPIIIPQKNKLNTLMVVLNMVLLILCGYLLYINFSQKEQLAVKDQAYEDVSAERSDLEDELNEMLADYEGLETENEDIRAELEAEKLKIEELLKKVKNGNWEVHKLKKEAASLREIMKGYIVTIDSLNTLNQNLIVENTSVRQNLKKEQGRNEELQKVNSGLSNQVAIAQRLKAFNISSYGVRVKNDNTGKTTDRAKKTDKIRTCFSLGENKLADSGNKDLFIRILTPDGRILSAKSDDSHRFSFNGVEGLFSIKKQINYQNSEMQVCMDWKKIKDFPIGEYVIEIYCDNVDIGKTKMTLR